MGTLQSIDKVARFLERVATTNAIHDTSKFLLLLMCSMNFSVKREFGQEFAKKICLHCTGLVSGWGGGHCCCNKLHYNTYKCVMIKVFIRIMM